MAASSSPQLPLWRDQQRPAARSLSEPTAALVLANGTCNGRFGTMATFSRQSSREVHRFHTCDNLVPFREHHFALQETGSMAGSSTADCGERAGCDHTRVWQPSEALRLDGSRRFACPLKFVVGGLGVEISGASAHRNSSHGPAVEGVASQPCG